MQNTTMVMAWSRKQVTQNRSRTQRLLCTTFRSTRNWW